MRTPKRTSVILPVVASMLMISAAFAFVPTGPGNEPPSPYAHRLHITGRVRNLYPGKHAKLVLKVRNPFEIAVRVRWIKVHVTPGVGPAGTCPSRSLVVKTWHGDRRLAAHHTRRFRLKLRMRVRAPNKCVGTRYRLTYSAKATRS